ncbi:MAG: CD1871A family CXXC motif-containing protein [Gemmiger sp.]|nr:CD1871A family CXXC motif-containing protein [Gemmiger sp.]
MSRRLVTAALLAAGVVLVGIGVAAGEPGVVLQKAASICAECIGLG